MVTLGLRVGRPTMFKVKPQASRYKLHIMFSLSRMTILRQDTFKARSDAARSDAALHFRKLRQDGIVTKWGINKILKYYPTEWRMSSGGGNNTRRKSVNPLFLNRLFGWLSKKDFRTRSNRTKSGRGRQSSLASLTSIRPPTSLAKPQSCRNLKPRLVPSSPHRYANSSTPPAGSIRRTSRSFLQPPSCLLPPCHDTNITFRHFAIPEFRNV